MSAAVVPVHLGCCREPRRCLLCGAPPALPSPELVDALIHAYAARRAEGRGGLRVSFLGGAAPTDELLEAAGGLPFSARVRPDLLTRAEAARLAARGCVRVELDLLGFRDDALASVGRRHGARRAEEMIAGLPALGLEVGAVLAPGLPGTSHQDALADARRVAGRVRAARIHPVLVLEGSGLAEQHRAGTFAPLTLGQAVTTARAMVDALEAGGTEVIRIGQSPLSDGIGRAVAGPVHPSLRQLVESRRVLDRLREQLAPARAGSAVVVRCHPADETVTRGPLNQHLRALRADHRLAAVRVRPDRALSRGELAVDILCPEVA